jgi:hypothetical protein
LLLNTAGTAAAVPPEVVLLELLLQPDATATTTASADKPMLFNNFIKICFRCLFRRRNCVNPSVTKKIIYFIVPATLPIWAFSLCFGVNQLFQRLSYCADALSKSCLYYRNYYVKLWCLKFAAITSLMFLILVKTFISGSRGLFFGKGGQLPAKIFHFIVNKEEPISSFSS